MKENYSLFIVNIDLLGANMSLIYDLMAIPEKTDPAEIDKLICKTNRYYQARLISTEVYTALMLDLARMRDEAIKREEKL